MNELAVKLLGLGLALAVLAGAVLGYGHHQYGKGVAVTTDHYEAAIERTNAEAAAKLAAETDKARAKERELAELKNHQELLDENHQKTVVALSERLRTAAGPVGRLRDPNAEPGCGAGGGGAAGGVASAAGAGAADAGQAGGLLSTGITELFRRLTREADDINDAYASCRADSYAVRGVKGVGGGVESAPGESLPASPP